MSEKTKRILDDVLPEVDPDEDLMKSVWTSRAKTELMANQLKQATIDSALKQLSGGEKNFAAEISIPEMIALAQALPGKKLDEFMLLGYFVERAKKLGPQETRRELVAFLKVWPQPDRARDKKFYDAGLDVGAEGVKAGFEAGSKRLSGVEIAKIFQQRMEKAKRTFESLESG
jgi:hypothetical protein